MFDRIETDDPDGMNELVEQEMVIRFRLRAPDAEDEELEVGRRRGEVHCRRNGSGGRRLTRLASRDAHDTFLHGWIGCLEGLEDVLAN